jgi:hypothetical protein
MATAAAVASAAVTPPCCTSSLVAAISSTSSAQTLLPPRYSTFRVSLLKSGGSQKVKRNPLSEDIICFSIISSPKSLSLSLSLSLYVSMFDLEFLCWLIEDLVISPVFKKLHCLRERRSAVSKHLRNICVKKIVSSLCFLPV